MKRSLEAIGILLALAGFVVSILTWLLPFEPIGPSPFSARETSQSTVIAAPPPEPTATAQPTLQQETPVIITQTSAQVTNTFIEAQANLKWQDTGISVSAGDDVTIRYVSGQWSIWLNNPGDPLTDGNGQSGRKETCHLLPQANLGSLIGKIADTPPFFVGNETSFHSDSTSNLFLSMNNCGNFKDNGGSLTVNVRVWR